MSEEDWDKSNPRILNKMIDLSERMLGTHESANILIVICIVLGALVAVGIGIVLTQAAAPVPQTVISVN